MPEPRGMRVLKHALISAVYLMLAVAVALVSPGLTPAIGPETAAIAGALAFVAAALIHEAAVRFDATAAAAAEIDALRAELDGLRQAVHGVKGEIGRIDGDVTSIVEGGESKAREDLDRVVSEVRVLQNLIGQLSEKGGAAGKPGRADRAPRREEPAPRRDIPETEDGGLDQTVVLDIVREGLRCDRVDLYLQPVVSLPQRKTRFYECFSRIRAEDGGLILPEQYLEVAKSEGLVGAIDNMLLFRCVQLVRRAQSRRHNVGFFCNVSGNTLADTAFAPDFVEFMANNNELSRNLIFEFSQADLSTHAAEIEAYATRLGRLGFYFSLDNVTDLSRLDFQALARRRFKYVKIRAGTLMAPPEPARAAAPALEREGIEGSASEGAADADTVIGINVPMLKRAMDVNGIDLIVEKLENEQTLVELLDYRIDYGQGYLFGEPRLSREA